MNGRNLALTTLVLGVILACASAEGAQRDWVFLGQRDVADRADHDLIGVSAPEDFARIRLEVRRRPVQFRRVAVHFRNGTHQEIELATVIAAGGQSRDIDLEGNERYIRSVEFWYDAQSGGRRAIVRLLGER
jgi:hypothetical protein